MTRVRTTFTVAAAVSLASMALLVACAAGPATAPAAHAPVGGTLPLYEIRPELGLSQFNKGDRIKIEKVLCTGKTIAPAEICIVSGTYTLASADKATLAFYITSKYGNGFPDERRQTVEVKRGSGKFELHHALSSGWPHLSFYANGVTGVYFGQGESVLKSEADYEKPEPGIECTYRHINAPEVAAPKGTARKPDWENW